MISNMFHLAVLAGNIFLVEALVVTPPRNWYEINRKKLCDDIQNLTSRVGSLDKDVQTVQTSIDKSNKQVAVLTVDQHKQEEFLMELKDDHETRLKTLEDNFLQLKSSVEILQRVCPLSFTFVHNPKLCFKVMHEPLKSQKEKNARCSELVNNGRLIQLETPHEVEMMKMRNLTEDDYVIGGKRSGTNQWKWLDGTHVSMSMFCPGEPNYSGARPVLNLYVRDTGFCLDDIADDNSNDRFICELPM